MTQITQKSSGLSSTIPALKSNRLAPFLIPLRERNVRALFWLGRAAIVLFTLILYHDHWLWFACCVLVSLFVIADVCSYLTRSVIAALGFDGRLYLIDSCNQKQFIQLQGEVLVLAELVVFRYEPMNTGPLARRATLDPCAWPALNMSTWFIGRSNTLFLGRWNLSEANLHPLRQFFVNRLS